MRLKNSKTVKTITIEIKEKELENLNSGLLALKPHLDKFLLEEEEEEVLDLINIITGR